MTNIIIVNAEIFLYRNDLIIKKLHERKKLTTNEKKLLKREATRIVNNPKNLYMHLFFTADQKFRGVVMEILKDIDYRMEKDKIIFFTKVRYIFPRPISKGELREVVKDTFAHYMWAGDIAYKLKKFTVTSQKKNRASIKTKNEAYVNLYGSGKH